MKFSLIVSTIGREEPLRLLLHSLVEQRRTDFEVIVVDQSQANGIAGVVAEFAGALPLRHEPMKERGACRGRNRGIALSTAEIVTFPDDDCTYPPGVLDRVAAKFAAQPDIDALTTRAETMGRCDTRGGKIDRGNLLLRCVEFTLFARRDRLGDLRFDEQVGPGAGTPWGADDGPDLMLRMLDQGMHLEYFPEIVILHPDPTIDYEEAAMRRSYSYSCARGRLFRKYGFSVRVVAWALFRSLVGSLLMLCTGRFRRAKFYWLSFTGKWAGYTREDVKPYKVPKAEPVA